MRNTEGAVPGEDAPAGRELVERLDHAAAMPDQRSGRSSAELNVGFLLWPRFPLPSLAGLCDALRHAADLGDQSRPLRCSWTIIGERDEVVEASCGVKVTAQAAFPPVEQFDYIVAIGGLLPHLDDAHPSYWDYLRQADRAGIPLIGMCTGSFVLARAGLMV